MHMLACAISQTSRACCFIRTLGLVWYALSLHAVGLVWYALSLHAVGLVWYALS
jgi:ABC-type sugar transport system permease subunit